MKKDNEKAKWNQLTKKLSVTNMKRGFQYFRKNGIRQLYVKAAERMQRDSAEDGYMEWLMLHRPTDVRLKNQREQKFLNPPLISVVVPAYRTPDLFLRQMIKSVCSQSYEHLELCIADGSGEDTSVERIVKEFAAGDSRIKYQKLDKNLGISENTNRALSMAAGDFVGLLDHDDLLSLDALFEVASALEIQPDIDVLYSDEDKVSADETEFFQPHFKPDFNLDLLRSNNYICHFFVVRRAVVAKAGGFRSEFDGSQDYDFIFRCVENAGRICHIPKILYHWRSHSASTAENPESKLYAFEAGQRAVESHLKRAKIPAQVLKTNNLGFYRVKYPLEEKPLVSLIIPVRDRPDLLFKSLDGIRKKTAYGNMQLILVDQNSTDQKVLSFYKKMDGQNALKVVYCDSIFNNSVIFNRGAAVSDGEVLLFLVPGVIPASDRWLEDMVAVSQRPEVGITGVKTYDSKGRIRHAGMVVGLMGIAGRVFSNYPGKFSGYLHKASLQQNVSAVTGHCSMMRREVYQQTGGFTEILNSWEDVDLCLKVRKLGYLVAYDPFVQMRDYSDRESVENRGLTGNQQRSTALNTSKSRQLGDSEKPAEFKTADAPDYEDKMIQGFNDGGWTEHNKNIAGSTNDGTKGADENYMLKTWPEIYTSGDPYYNRNLTLKNSNYTIDKV